MNDTAKNIDAVKCVEFRTIQNRIGIHRRESGGRTARTECPGLTPVGAVVLLALILVTGSATAQMVDFAHDVFPIFRDRCASCHAYGKSEGDFSLMNRTSLLDAGVVDLDDPGASELLDRVQSSGFDRMPPQGDRLTAEQVAKLRQWIEEGAPWDEAIELRVASEPGSVRFRGVDRPPGGENPVDWYLQKYFSRSGLSWPEAASDQTVLRRMYLDLLGRLPTLEEQEQFRGWSGQEDRFERLADQLLARDRDYADHWIVFWNDLLRNDYSGTGYIDGGRKQITKWLHRSLYQNKPYDQFVRELIHPNGESEGFIRGIQWRGNVNASQSREVQFAQNVAQVFLGENLKCASCHDSFVDHWKLRDAWSMAAIVADQPLEMYRCDQPTGETATARFLWPELGEIPVEASVAERLEKTAELITGSENGRFATTIVNRLWDRLIGVPIVTPVDRMSNPPFDPDLLDGLALEFRDEGYDLRNLMRTIVTSKIYRAQVVPLPAPGGNVFTGPVMKRLTAEQFMDAVYRVCGQWPEQPDASVGPYSGDEQSYPVRAGLLGTNPFLLALGRPVRDQVITTRPDQVSTLQALNLSNGELLAGLIQRGAEKWCEQGYGRDELVELLYRTSLVRGPVPQERTAIAEFMDEQPKPDQVADLIWSILMLPEFHYVL